MSNPSIFILTDRPDKGRRLKRDLSLIGSCHVVAPHAPPTADAPLAIVADLALDSAEAVGIVRSTMLHSGGGSPPLVCILRSGSRRDDSQARALGAGAVLPLDAPRSSLIRAVIGALAGDDADIREITRDEAREAGLALADIMDAIEDGQPIPLSRLPEGARHITRAIEKAGLRTWLDVVWSFDDATYQHVLLVAGLAAAFAQGIGFAPRDCRRVAEAALLHDVGKIGVPIEILNKPGKLDADEIEVMRRHAQNGHAALVLQGGVSDEVLAAVRSHHEYLDGSGYPDGLSGSQISDTVRIITICDIFGALVENRPYRKQMAAADALRIMRGMGGKLDGDIFAAFERMIERLRL